LGRGATILAKSKPRASARKAYVLTDKQSGKTKLAFEAVAEYPGQPVHLQQFCRVSWRIPGGSDKFPDKIAGGSGRKRSSHDRIMGNKICMLKKMLMSMVYLYFPDGEKP